MQLAKQKHFGVDKIALNWCRNYISERTQTTLIANNISEKKPVTKGVPQGSILGPLLFTIYSADQFRAVGTNDV